MQVYPLMAAMTFVTSMCVFQLTRNMFMNPDVRYVAWLSKLIILLSMHMFLLTENVQAQINLNNELFL